MREKPLATAHLYDSYSKRLSQFFGVLIMKKNQLNSAIIRYELNAVNWLAYEEFEIIVKCYMNIY